MIFGQHCAIDANRPLSCHPPTDSKLGPAIRDKYRNPQTVVSTNLLNALVRSLGTISRIYHKFHICSYCGRYTADPKGWQNLRPRRGRISGNSILLTFIDSYTHMETMNPRSAASILSYEAAN